MAQGERTWPIPFCLVIELELPTMTSMVGNYSSKHDVWNDTSSCLEWPMVVERVVRFGEGTFVIGTCKKPAWTLMMSCGTWNERESRNVP